MTDDRAEPSLRAVLKRGTADSHDALDRAAASLNLEQPDDYARFLRWQLAARAPIEDWVAGYCPAPLAPPPSVALLRADLADLGDETAGAAAPVVPFALPAAAHPSGLAWALAGSHLGNRMMLAGLRRSGASLPTRFLADPRLPEFWRSLRPLLEQVPAPVPAAAALSAAEAVFACFARALTNSEPRLAA